MKLISLTILCLILSACSKGGGGVSGSGNGGGAKGQRIDDWKVNLLGQEGHGGDAIVCFSIPVTEALEQQKFGQSNECPVNTPCDTINRPIGPGSPSSGTAYRMTEAGRKSIRSAKPLEQFQAERSASGRFMIDQLNQMTPEEGYQKLLKPFTALPAPFNRIKETHRKLGWLKEKGVADEYGLADINDSGFENNIDKKYCKELQDVVRRDNQLWYDEAIFAAFDTAGQVLIQLHEEIYAWAKSVDKINFKIGGRMAHEMSDKSRRLILQMLDQNADSQVINDNLEDLGFSIMFWDPKGRYMDTQTCAREQEVLKNFLAGYHRDLWLDLQLFMQNRYLDRTYAMLELQHNYPDILSDMIGLTMAGDSPTFWTEITQLQREFEKPESCEGRF